MSRVGQEVSWRPMMPLNGNVSKVHGKPCVLYPSSPSELTFGRTLSPEPKPSRGWRNVRNSLLFIGALLGMGANVGFLASFHSWAKERVINTRTEKNPSTTNSSLLDQVAKADVSLRESLPLALFEDIANVVLFIECLMFANFMRKHLAKPGIRPHDIWKEFHQQGITGKGIKVGLVDSGFRPVGTLNQRNIEYYTVGTPEKKEYLMTQDPHGSAVAHIIGESCPDSSFFVVSQAYSEIQKVIDSNIQNFLNACEEDAENLTLPGLVKVFQPYFNNLSEGVETAVDKGVQVINLSLSVDQRLLDRPVLYLFARIEQLAEKFKQANPQDPRVVRQFESQFLNYFKLLEKMMKLFASENRTSKDMEALKNIMAPWRQALDKAYQKEIPIMLGAGNLGFLQKQLDNTPFGGMNLLGLIPHPALIVVGSTNHSGEVSTFSSEWQDENHPWIAGNGSGELLTKIPPPCRPFLHKILMPFEGLKKQIDYEQAHGTSFSTPDVTALYVMMKSLYPKLTVDETKEILAIMAEPAHFAQEAIMQYEKEMVAQLQKNPKPNQFTQALYLKMVSQELDKLAATGNPIKLSIEEVEGRYRVHLEGNYSEEELLTLTKTIQSQLDQLAKLSVGHQQGLSPKLLKELLDKKLTRIVGHGRVNRYAAMAEAEKRSKASK